MDLKAKTNNLDGNNIIHKLVNNNDPKVLEEGLEILLEKGELKKLINKKNYSGYTPLHCAIMNGSQKCSQILINNGANIEIPTDDGYYVKWINDKNNKKKIIGKRIL